MAVSTRVDKRRAILDAAGPLFGEQGYERASVDAIAAAAGVSKPTVYSHFGTKEQLFRDSIAESAAQLNADLMAALASMDVGPDTWRAGLYAVAAELLAAQRTDCSQCLQRMISAEVRRDPEVIRAVRARSEQPVIEALAGRLAMLGNARHLEVPDPRLAARQFLALTNAEIAELSELGTRDVTAVEVEAASARGVDTFLAAFEARR